MHQLDNTARYTYVLLNDVAILCASYADSGPEVSAEGPPGWERRPAGGEEQEGAFY